jgi:GNAT superfamily N-acetyltransferase
VTTVRVAAAEDAEEVGRVLADGFLADPVMAWVFGEPGRERKLRAFFDFLAREAYLPLSGTYVLPGACAVWTPPGTPDWPEERSARFLEVLHQECSSRDRHRLGILGKAADAHRPDQPHWYLSAVAVVASSQGRGLGSALLRESLRTVDSDGLPAYLESTNPRNVTLYERHGFVATGQVPLAEAGPVLTTMWREPSVT